MGSAMWAVSFCEFLLERMVGVGGCEGEKGGCERVFEGEVLSLVEVVCKLSWILFLDLVDTL